MSDAGFAEGRDRDEASGGVTDGGRTLVLGFSRGVAPNKWARRWADAADAAKRGENGAHGDFPELQVVPLGVNGRPLHGQSCDVLLERVAPGGRPAGVGTEPGSDATRRGVRLYAEAVALVVPADHELAGETAVDRGTLDLVTLLAHPDHASGWPDPEPWADPAWAPADAAAALELVATGLGAILLPLPFARHLASKRAHAVLPVTGEPPLQGTEIWATWAADRDAADVQQLVGIMRGRTARSGRAGNGDAGGGPDPAVDAPAAQGSQQSPKAPAPRQKQKAGPPKNSRGAQLAAARAKRSKRGRR
jgi:hypothetical protein